MRLPSNHNFAAKLAGKVAAGATTPVYDAFETAVRDFAAMRAQEIIRAIENDAHGATGLGTPKNPLSAVTMTEWRLWQQATPPTQTWRDFFFRGGLRKLIFEGEPPRGVTSTGVLERNAHWATAVMMIEGCPTNVKRRVAKGAGVIYPSNQWLARAVMEDALTEPQVAALKRALTEKLADEGLVVIGWEVADKDWLRVHIACPAVADAIREGRIASPGSSGPKTVSTSQAATSP